MSHHKQKKREIQTTKRFCEIAGFVLQMKQWSESNIALPPNPNKYQRIENVEIRIFISEKY